MEHVADFRKSIGRGDSIAPDKKSCKTFLLFATDLREHGSSDATNGAPSAARATLLEAERFRSSNDNRLLSLGLDVFQSLPGGTDWAPEAFDSR